MFVNHIITLLERERSILTDENHHSSAILIGEAVGKLRQMAAVMREHGLDPDQKVEGA